MSAFIYLASFFLLAFSPKALGQLALSGRIVDEARVLSSAQSEELDRLLSAYEQKSGNQLVVVSVNSLQQKNIEDFGYELGRQWGIGTKGKDNGVLLIIAPSEREVRIEVGYGLEEILTDAKSKIIIERVMLPYFRSGEMAQGIIAGTRALISALGGEEVVAQPENSAETHADWTDILFFIFILGILFFRIFYNTFGRGPRPPGRGGLFGGPGSGTGSRGGGFGGRGGSFGGGGASGKW